MSMNSSALCQVSSLETSPAGIMGVRGDGDLTSLQQDPGCRDRNTRLLLVKAYVLTADYGILHDHRLKQLQFRM